MRVNAAMLAILLALEGCANSSNQSTITSNPPPLSLEAQNLATSYGSAFEAADEVKLRKYLDRSTDARSKLADAIIENAKATLQFRRILEQELSSAKSRVDSSIEQQMNIFLTGGYAFADSPHVLVLTEEGWRVRFMGDATDQLVSEMVSIQNRRTAAITRFLDASDKNGAMGNLVSELMASLTEELSVSLLVRGGTDEFMRTIGQDRVK
jgi:hypothetical protein